MVRIVPYHADWPELFHVESNKVAAVFGEEVTTTHHIGSTAIPGIERAKPCIDMLLEVPSITKVDDFDDEMIELGYVPRGEYGIAGRRFFFKDVEGLDAIQTYHVHAYQSGYHELERHLNFRDYLVAHPKEARAYSRLKEHLSKRFPRDMTRYTDGKTEFIAEIDRKAKAWKDKEPSLLSDASEASQ